MKTTKSVLGRGLEALIKVNGSIETRTLVSDDKTSDIEALIFSNISIDNISPNPFQPRIEFDEISLNELKNSILEKGVIQPITVRRLDGENFQLISGERRLRASKLANLSLIPAYIIEVNSDAEMLEIALIENIQRDTLNPIEVAFGFKRLIDEQKITQDDVAKKTGKDRTTVANFIRLLKLPQEIQQSLIKNEITTGHARAILSVDNFKDQLELWKQIIENKFNVRTVEKIAKENKKNKNKSNNSKDPNLTDLENTLRIVFGTKVDVRLKSGGKGEINISFYSNDDLERILEILHANK